MLSLYAVSNLFGYVVLLIGRSLFLAAFSEMFYQKHDMNDEHDRIHKRRGIGRQQNPVHNEHDAADGIDDAGLDLITR